MQFRSVVPSIAAVLAVAGTIACSDSTAPSSNSVSPSASFETQATADLAPSAGEAIATDYLFYSSADLTGSGALFSVNVPGASLINPGAGVSASVQMPLAGASAAWISPSCVLNPNTGRFGCPPVNKNGQTFTTSYALFDAAGVAQSKFDKVTTASINFIVTDTGATSFTSNGNTAADTTSRRHNRTVSGLAGDPDTVHTWSGTGSSAIHSVRSGQISKVYQFISNDTSTAVRFRQPRDINPYPLSGTIVRNYTVTRTRYATDTTTKTTSRRVVVTFNGTATVPMTVGSDTFTLNLDTHKVAKP
ncbi:MAG: hypothetical protein ACR2MQ_13800 [Gemmatimonadaceae bacterium]